MSKPESQGRIQMLLRTGAILCSPKYLKTTARNAMVWLKISRKPQALQAFSVCFDERFYLQTYPDVRESGIRPAVHYIFRGFIEKRLPSGSFDAEFYLRTNPDVAELGLNPVLHYVLFGKAEGRLPAPPPPPDVTEIDASDECAPAAAQPQLADEGCPDQVKSGAPAKCAADPMPAPLSAEAAASPNESGSAAVMESRPVIRINNLWNERAPLISVVIPCFNYGAYIEEAIGSILAQTFDDIEVIVVEGGSTDKTSRLKVKALETHYPGGRFLYREGRHLVGDNRNYGISHAQGRYICCLDADDLLKPIYLEIAVFLAEGYGFDLVSSSLQAFGESTITWLLQDPSFPSIADYNQISTTALFRRSAWAHAGGFRDWGLGEEYIFEDWEFWVRLLGHGCRAKSIREPLMLYRVHSGGLTDSSKTDCEFQAKQIRAANQALLDQSGEPPPPAPALQIANRWVNLVKRRGGVKPGILIALPFITVGGAEELFATILSGLSAVGYQPIVITTLVLPETTKSVPDRYCGITSNVYHLPGLFDPFYWPEFVTYLLRRYDIEIILLAGCEFLYHQLPEIKAAFPKIRVVDQLFNDTGHLHNNRRYAEYIDCIAVPSGALADTLIQKHSEDAGKVAIIPHGVDVGTSVWHDSEAAFRAAGLPERARGKLIVSFFGRMSREKNPQLFVEIACKLSSAPDLFFCMTGEGPEWQETKDLIARYGMERCFYTPGFLPDARPLMELTDIVVLPSSVDGMPLTVLEAQALGKPVVASAVGSLPDVIVDGRSGFLCPAGNAPAFCERIQELAESAALRHAIGAEAMQSVRANHSKEAMILRYLEVLFPLKTPERSRCERETEVVQRASFA